MNPGRSRVLNGNVQATFPDADPGYTTLREAQ